MPPAVAQAPMATRSFASARRRAISTACSGRRDRALDEEDVEWARRAARGRLGELHDVEPLGDLEQVVLDVEDRQLAAVAGGELDDADPRSPWRGGGRARSSGRRAAAARRATSITGPPAEGRRPSSATLKTGPSRQTKRVPNWQCPHSPTPHSMCRSRVSHVWSVRDRRGRRGRSPCAAIIRSGPQMKAVASEPVPWTLLNSCGDDADPAEPLGPGPVDGHPDERRRRSRPAASISSTNRRSRGVRAPR